MTAGLGIMVGALGAWSITTFLLRMDWVFDPVAAGIPALLAIGLALAAGGIGIWRALAVPAGPLLRNS